MRKGAYGAGRAIWDISGVRTMVRTVNIMINVRALVCIVVKLNHCATYLRVVTQKRVAELARIGLKLINNPTLTLSK